MKILGMEVYRRKTDEEIVKSIRNSVWCARWYPHLLMAVSLLYIGTVVFTVWIVFHLGSLFNQPGLYESGFFLGSGLGLVLSVNAIIGLHLFVRSWILLAGSRIDILLLRYHDELMTLKRNLREDRHC